MINPGAIPEFTGDLDQLESDASGLKSDAHNIARAGVDVHAAFQGLAAFYSAPEAQQLFASTKPVADTATSFGDSLATVAAALTEYAGDVRPIAAQLKHLSHRPPRSSPTPGAITTGTPMPAWSPATTS